MSDIDFPPGYFNGLIVAICIATVGFLPGFYLSYLGFVKAKMHFLQALPLSLATGITSSVVIFFVLAYLPKNIDLGNYTYIISYVFYFLALEVLIILLHFFFSRPRIKERKGK